MTTLIIARHGNTFTADETPTRVGLHTDLPLVETGRAQAVALGTYLKNNGLIPDTVYSSNLRRTIETAEIAIKTTGVSNPIYKLDIFNEIDYGPDENKPEADVIARIGAEAIAKWDSDAIVPNGWIVDPDKIIQNWRGFAKSLLTASTTSSPCTRGSAPLIDKIPAQGGDDDLASQNEITLVVTSNGTARFAPHLTGDFDGFRNTHDIKLSTGALSILKHDGEKWHVVEWNVRP